MTKPDLLLIGCGREKRADGPCAARDLYSGRYFRACRDYIGEQYVRLTETTAAMRQEEMAA